MLKPCLVASFALLSAACLLPRANAETFNFTVTGIGSNYSASGTLTGTQDANDPNAFDITSGTGTSTLGALTLVTPGATEGNIVNVTLNGNPYQYDDIVFPNGSAYSGGAQIDLYGLLFSDGTDHTNFFFQNGTYVYSTDESGATDYLVNFNIASPAAVTPEPSSIALLGTGMLGIAGVLRRRFVWARA